MRRAHISEAEILYASTVPPALREKDPAHALKEGAEVRVTADQGGDGEWRAIRVEILKVRRRRPRPKVQPTRKTAALQPQSDGLQPVS